MSPADPRHASSPPRTALLLSTAAVLVSVAGLSNPASTQTAPRAFKAEGRSAGHGLLAGLEHRVHFDHVDDATIWVAGDTYKARFDGSGFTYIPFLGSCAPRNYPVSLRVESIRRGGEPIAVDPHARPVRDGQRVTFDRGSVLEIYDLALDSIEQSFVFERLHGEGDLVVELAVDSDLERAHDDRGLVLRGEHGSVRYGFAVSFDQRGERVPAPTSWQGSSIALRVPAERTSGARWPLVIDPVISTFDVDSNATEDHSVPDVAYDVTTVRYLAVFERAFSATDHDVYSWLLDFSGSHVASGFIDVSSAYWANPKVANNGDADQFLTVAEVGIPSAAARDIRGRTREATGSGALGAPFTLNGTESGDKTNPDVGGDPYVAPSFYCVVWQREAASDDFDIFARFARPDGTLFGIGSMPIDNSAGTYDVSPTISKTNGQGPEDLQAWNVVWHRRADLFDFDLRGAQMSRYGWISTFSFPIDTSATNTTNATVTTLTTAEPRRYLIAYTANSSTWGKLLEGTSVVDTANLTTLAGAPSGEVQQSPSADCDGSLFVVADSESYLGSSTDFDVYVSTFSMVGDQIALAEGHVNLAFGTEREDQVEITTTGSSGGSTRRTMAVWHQATGTNNGDIEGALYGAHSFTTFCVPGIDAVMACPCGNAPTQSPAGCNNSSNTGGASLEATGSVPTSVVLHAADTKPTALCIFLQGNALIANGTPYGDGLRCAGGTLKRLYVKTASGGAASAPGASDLSITARSAALGDPISAGTKRWYQVYYRDPASFACSGSATFNVSNGVQLDW